MMQRLFLLALLIGAPVFAGPQAKAPQTKLRPALLAPKTIEPMNAAEFRALLEHHRGSVILVNLWATWCIPCLKELPDLAALEKTYAAKGFKLILVSTDDPAELAAAKKLLAQRAPSLTGYLQAEDDLERFVNVIDPAWADIMPTSYLLNREGKLHRKLTGGKSREEFEKEILPLF